MSHWKLWPQGVMVEYMSHVHPHDAVRSRRRNLAELYVRAYWPAYTLALGWVVGVELLIFTMTGR